MFFCILRTSTTTPTKSSFDRLAASLPSSRLERGPGKMPSKEMVEKADSGDAKSSPR
jgi:hypothetical protein